MHYPAFFDQAPIIRLRDPLMRFLGSSDDGVIDYSYLDAVKLAGHSCPTVAGSYLMARKGLAYLYGEDLPERGAVAVSFAEDRDAGVTGVMANILSLITGARQDDGFKGIGGRFDRCNLLRFGQEMAGEIALTRLDSGACVVLGYHPHIVPAAPDMRPLLQKCAGGIATEDEQAAFGRIWQDRVRAILIDHPDDPALISVGV